MRGLDTNVLVRHLTQDQPAQSARASALIESAESKGERWYVSGIVLCELVWVLRAAYKLPKRQVTVLLERLLDTASVVIEDRDLVLRAVEAYGRGKGDFADYLLGLRNREAGCSDTVTLDGALRTSDLFSVV